MLVLKSQLTLSKYCMNIRDAAALFDVILGKKRQFFSGFPVKKLKAQGLLVYSLRIEPSTSIEHLEETEKCSE